jgi:adenylate cyclase
VARDVIAKIKIGVTPQEKAALTRPRLANSQAYEAYLRGRQLLNRQRESDYRKAAEEFRLSIDDSPSFAPAYAGLADSYDNMSWWFVPALDILDAAKGAARKAVALDPTLAEGHISLAIISGFIEWDWTFAEKEIRSAIALNPSLADGHHWFCHLLEAEGRLDAAVSEIQRAHDLDPLSPLFDKDLALNYFYRREYDRS